MVERCGIILFILYQGGDFLMNDFENMCKELNCEKTGGGSHCYSSNNYLYVKSIVNNYISGGSGYKDKTQLLHLKSECRNNSFEESTSLLVSTVSMAICILSLLLNILMDCDLIVLKVFILLILIIYCLILLSSFSKVKLFRKWQPYILTAIEEIEKELQ